MTTTWTFTLENKHPTDITLCLEMSGDGWPMPSGAKYEIRFEFESGETNHVPYIRMEPEMITIYAGNNGDLRVFENEREINSSNYDTDS